jgi:hypothetical protein
MGSWGGHAVPGKRFGYLEFKNYEKTSFSFINKKLSFEMIFNAFLKDHFSQFSVSSSAHA